jgi:hypothetical protein
MWFQFTGAYPAALYPTDVSIAPSVFRNLATPTAPLFSRISFSSGDGRRVITPGTAT